MSRRDYGHERWRGPRMERGDLRYVLLDLLKDRPSYGYELIQALEERFHGFYTPSAGTVYPTLQWLQDLGYLSVAEQDGRKVYTVTDEGRSHLEERKAKVDEVWRRMGARWGGPPVQREMNEEWQAFGREMHEMMREMRELFKGFRRDARWATPEQMRRAREVIARAGKEVEEILRQPEG